MTLLRAISGSFTPSILASAGPSESKNLAARKKITHAFNVPCFCVKVAKAKRARGFRIDHSAGPNCAPLPSQQQTNCHNASNYEQSVFGKIPGVRQEKLIEYRKIRLFFFLTRQSPVTRFPEFVQIKFLLNYLFPQEFDPVDQARARGLTSLSPIERCRMHTEKHR